jgi:peptide/nickel transport system substrate-binding protein
MRQAGWLLAGILATQGCAPRHETDRQGAALTVAVQADITGLYPALRNESFSFAVNGNVFEGLTVLGHGLGPQPALADRWETPDDHTWLFHLRPGVRFSDGALVRARDVVASVRYAANSATTRTLLAPVESVDAAGEDTVRIRTRFPCPVLLAHLSFALVVPEAALSDTPGAPGPGTGPYQIEDWIRGKELRLARNPRYWGAAASFDRVRFVVMPDAGERLAALRAGHADIVDNVPAGAMEALRKTADLRVVSRPSLRVLFLVLRVDQPPFSNPLVREALDVALDRGEIVHRAMGGLGTPTGQLVPPPVLGYNPEIGLPRHDPARARELLRAAGYRSGLSLRLNGPTDRYAAGVEIMKEVARQLRDVGIEIDVDARPKEAFFSLADSRHYNFLLYGWSCETIQAGEALDELIHTADPDKEPNVEAFGDRAIDDLIDRADESPLIPERSELLAQALAAVARARPVIPLAIQSESFAFSANRVAWDPSLDMALHIADVHRAAATPGLD